LKTLLETEGIVLKSIKYSETSIILDIYTLDYGLKSFIINGVRSSKSKASASMFQVMNFLKISFYDKENDVLLRPTEYNYLIHYKSLPTDIFKSAVGVFMAELTRNSIKEKGEFEDLYLFIKKSYIILDENNLNQLPNFYINYLLDLSRHLGFYPHNNHNDTNVFFDMMNGYFSDHIVESKYTMTSDVSLLLHQVITEPTKRLLPTERDVLIDELLIYYKLHIENFRELKSLTVLREIF
jgi:DNA repair protein RecO (recombination protein O)